MGSDPSQRMYTDSGKATGVRFASSTLGPATRPLRATMGSSFTARAEAIHNRAPEGLENGRQ